MPNKLGIEGFCSIDVMRPLNNGSAIWKYSEIVPIRCETEHELVMRHGTLSCTLQYFRQGGEVQLTGCTMSDLHRISTTERCGMGAHLAFQPLKVPLLAARTIDFVLQFADLEATELVVPDIHIDQFPVDGFDVTSQDFDGFSSL